MARRLGIPDLDDTENVLTTSEDDPKLAGISNLLKNKPEIQNMLQRVGILGCSSVFMAQAKGRPCRGFCPSEMAIRCQGWEEEQELGEE